MLEVIATQNVNEFIKLPFTLYKGNAHYIHELTFDTRHLLTKDPFWAHARRQLFLAKRGGKTVGRIAAIINDNHNKHAGDKAGFFGFFETENKQATASALIAAAKAWLKQNGCDSMRGPVNPDTNHPCGILLDNYDKDPMVMMPYNPPYYVDLLHAAGLVKAKDLLAFERTDKDQFSPRMLKIIARVLKNPSIKMRRIDLKNIAREIEIVRKIYNASWAKNWGFVPITEAEIQEIAKQLKLVVKTEVTSVLEYDGVPAGFSISVPNMNRVLKILRGGLYNPLRVLRALLAWHNIKDCRMIMLGVDPAYRGKGLELLLVKEVVETGISYGWNLAELSWILEDNEAIISVIEESGCHRTKSYRIFEIQL